MKMGSGEWGKSIFLLSTLLFGAISAAWMHLKSQISNLKWYNLPLQGTSDVLKYTLFGR